MHNGWNNVRENTQDCGHWELGLGFQPAHWQTGEWWMADQTTLRVTVYTQPHAGFGCSSSHVANSSWMLLLQCHVKWIWFFLNNYYTLYNLYTVCIYILFGHMHLNTQLCTLLCTNYKLNLSILSIYLNILLHDLIQNKMYNGFVFVM